MTNEEYFKENYIFKKTDNGNGMTNLQADLKVKVTSIDLLDSYNYFNESNTRLTLMKNHLNEYNLKYKFID